MSEIIPAAAPGDPWVIFMQRAMADPNFDTNKFAALLEMRHREMEQQRLERAEERKRTFSEALTAFQAEVDPIVRDAVNPFLKNKYATLMKTVETAQPFLGKHGLNVRYVSADAPPGWLKMGIIVGHDCGYEDEPFWLSAQTTDTGSKGGKLPMTPSQAVAATMTYLRRQLYTNALNLVAGEIDDDGEALRGHAAGTYAPPEGTYRAPSKPPPPSPQRPTEAWQAWLLKLRLALSGKDEGEIAEICGRQTVLDALEHGPEWVQRDTKAIMAEAYEAATLRTDDKAEDIPFPDIAPGVEIQGEDKAAG